MTDADGDAARTSSPRCSSTSATTACAPSPWTRRTGWRAAPMPSTPARRSACPSARRRSAGSGTSSASRSTRASPCRVTSAGRSTATRPRLRRPLAEARDLRDRHQGHRPDRAVRARRQDRPLRRRGPRQDRAHPGADPQRRQQHGGVSVFAGVGERTREGNDLWLEMTESGVIDKVALVYGQMNEPPGARLRVGLSGLTMAEYFRDQGQDVLLFIDNIFRFVQAGSEVSALLGRMPSAVGYQPTLATEMGELQERITSTHDRLRDVGAGDLRPRRRPDRPGAGEHVRPPRRVRSCSRARSSRRASIRRSTRSSPSRARSSRAIVSRRALRRRRRACWRSSSATRICRTSSPSSAWTSSRTRTSSWSGRARKIERFLSQPNFVAEQFTGRPGKYVKLEDTIRGFREIVDGKHDELPRAGLLHGRHDRGGGREGSATEAVAARSVAEEAPKRPGSRRLRGFASSEAA